MNQIILAFRLVYTYDLLVDRCIDDVINSFPFYYIKGHEPVQ